MSLDPSPSKPETLAQTLQREASRMGRRDWLDVGVGATAFLAGEAAVLRCAPLGHVAGLSVALCFVVLLVASRVRIDTPFGFTVPVQLGFVPLMFAAPLALVPPLVVAASAASGLVDVARGRLKAVRLLQAPGNCVFSLGPVAVFAIAGVAPQRAAAYVLVGALAAQFPVDFGIYAIRQRATRGSPLSEQVAESWVYGVDAALSWLALAVAHELRAASPFTVLSLLPLLALLGTFARERRKRLEGMAEVSNAYRGTALVLGDVVEADDGYTGKHCRSVVALALAVGSELGLAAERQRNLEFGALLHDVGKIAIPKDIINKPGKLNPDEWTTIKTHTVEGQRMLDQVGGMMREVGLIVRSHHERWDGEGYPDRLAGEAIPLEARIIACCDMWNAMRTDRPYRSALSYDAAMAEIVSCSGSQLDPRIVRVLVKAVERDERPLLDAPARAATVATGLTEAEIDAATDGEIAAAPAGRAAGGSRGG